MEMDLIARLLVQWTILTAAIMGLAEMYPLNFLGTVSPIPGKGTRKRYTALVYAVVLSVLAWVPGLVKVPPEEGPAGIQLVAVLVMALVAVGTSHLVVALKQARDKRKNKP